MSRNEPDTETLIRVLPGTGSLWDQYCARPPGFGFYQTFYPAPELDVAVDEDRWRKTHWGRIGDIAVRMGPAHVKQGRFSIKGGLAYTALLRIKALGDMPWLEVDVDSNADLRPLPVPDELPEILQPRWHPCRYCSQRFLLHVQGQCLFASTYFEPVIATWRTVYGDYLWSKRSMSYVRLVGSTTTTTTTPRRTAARTR